MASNRREIQELVGRIAYRLLAAKEYIEQGERQDWKSKIAQNRSKQESDFSYY